MVSFPSQGHSFATKSSKESVETGPWPKEGRNALRGTLRHFEMVTIRETKTVFFSNGVLQMCIFSK